MFWFLVENLRLSDLAPQVREEDTMIAEVARTLRSAGRRAAGQHDADGADRKNEHGLRPAHAPAPKHRRTHRASMARACYGASRDGGTILGPRSPFSGPRKTSSWLTA